MKPRGGRCGKPTRLRAGGEAAGPADTAGARCRCPIYAPASYLYQPSHGPALVGAAPSPGRDRSVHRRCLPAKLTYDRCEARPTRLFLDKQMHRRAEHLPKKPGRYVVCMDFKARQVSVVAFPP